MGDRSNVYIIDPYASDGEPDGHTGQMPPTAGIYVYSHWGGRAHLVGALEALTLDIARRRWDDGQYLARIIVQHLLPDENTETGYGLGLSMGDNEHPLLVIDPGRQLVGLRDEGTERGPLDRNQPATRTFAEVAAGGDPKATLMALIGEVV